MHQELPVNMKFVIEGMEETGSNGLDAMILAQRDTFFSDVDYIIISDCGWLSTRPALTYGTRGNCYFFAEVVHAYRETHTQTETFIFKLLIIQSYTHNLNLRITPALSWCVCRLKDLNRTYILVYMEAL